MKNTVLHNANTRGHADHGWLNAYHSFSFASWYNPERVQFGTLRVLNDDTVAAGMGFGTHPHSCGLGMPTARATSRTARWLTGTRTCTPPCP